MLTLCPLNPLSRLPGAVHGEPDASAEIRHPMESKSDGA